MPMSHDSKQNLLPWGATISKNGPHISDWPLDHAFAVNGLLEFPKLFHGYTSILFEEWDFLQSKCTLKEARLFEFNSRGISIDLNLEIH